MVACNIACLCLLRLLVRCCTQVRQGLYYNPYFPGGAIAMPRMLADGGVEYDDGTPSNSSQQAKVGGLGGRAVGVVYSELSVQQQ